MQKTPYFIGLDVGTSKVRCVIGMPEQNNPDYSLSVIGIGSSENIGMRKGCVSHVEDVTRAIGEAVAEAERMAGIRVKGVTVNVNGASIGAQMSSGMVSTNSPDRIITREDIVRVEEQATVINMPSNRDIIQIFTKGYKVDGQDNIKDPIGMQGVRLEADILVVTAGLQCIRTLNDSVGAAQLEIAERTVSSVAAAEVVLDRRQKESGTALVDIGAGTTNIAIVEDGEIVTLGVLPIGGQHITHDLAIGLKADLTVAEKIKVEFGSLKPESAVSKKVNFTFEGTVYEFDTSRIYDILVPRFEELLEEIDKVFAKAKRSRRLPGGVVFVGGVANTPGLANFASDQLELHTRIGKLHHVGGLADTVKATDYAAAIGLMTLDGILSLDDMNTQSGMRQNNSDGMITKLKNLIKK
jgi:cell division protein FtsA